MDALCPGLLGADRAVFSTTYCGRRLVPAFGAYGSSSGYRWWNNGLTRAGGAVLALLLPMLALLVLHLA